MGIDVKDDGVIDDTSSISPGWLSNLQSSKQPEPLDRVSTSIDVAASPLELASPKPDILLFKLTLMRSCALDYSASARVITELGEQIGDKGIFELQKAGLLNRVNGKGLSEREITACLIGHFESLTRISHATEQAAYFRKYFAEIAA